MGQIITKREQPFVARFAEVPFLIRIRVVVIGWKQGVLARTSRMLDRIVSAAAAQASKDALTFPSTPIVWVGARERSLNAAHP